METRWSLEPHPPPPSSPGSAAGMEAAQEWAVSPHLGVLLQGFNRQQSEHVIFTLIPTGVTIQYGPNYLKFKFLKKHSAK